MQTEHERYLAEEHFGRPTFVTDYPAEIKAFYMRLNDDGKTVAAADCLVPGVGEIVGGSQREERLDVLERRMSELGMDAEQYKPYLDLRRYGSCKHAGFGLGFERLVMYLTGMDNIRDVLPHPAPWVALSFNVLAVGGEPLLYCSSEVSNTIPSRAVTIEMMMLPPTLSQTT